MNLKINCHRISLQKHFLNILVHNLSEPGKPVNNKKIQIPSFYLNAILYEVKCVMLLDMFEKKGYFLLCRISIATTGRMVLLNSASSVNYQSGTFSVLCRYTNSKTLQVLQFFCKSCKCFY